MEEPAKDARLGQLRIDRSQKTHGRKLQRRLIPIVTLALLGLGAFVYFLSRPPEVSVAEVRAARPGERLTTLSATGYVASRRRSVVAPKIPGRLAKVLVEEGQAVKEGQELAKLEDDDARVALEQVKAAVQAARARSVRAGVMVEQLGLELERSRRLAATGAIAPAALDSAQSSYDANVAEKRAAEADLATALARVSAAELQLSQTVVRAPFAGTVVRKLADEGAMLAPAAITELDVGGIVELVDLEALEVEAEVSEDRLAEIKEGQPALVVLDAYPDDVFPGVTGTVRPAVDRSKATAVVKVRFDKIPAGALPDMGAKISFLSAPIDKKALAEEARLRVPTRAVVERDGHAIVLEVQGDRLRAAPVEVEERIGDEIVLRSGPPPGTRIAASGKNLKPGKRVRIAEAQP